MSTWPQTTAPIRMPAPVLPVSEKPATGAAKRILVVDDNLIIRKTLSMKLTSCGYEVLTAADGGTAVSTVRQQKPDLILLDISFPPDVAHGGGVAWDGFLIMQWLRRMDDAMNIPVIIITGGDPEQYRERSFAAGAVGFFHKPIDNDSLVSAIRHTLGEDSAPNSGGQNGQVQSAPIEAVIAAQSNKA